MNKHAILIATAEAKGSILASKRFPAGPAGEADAAEWEMRWRKSGARTTVRVASPPPPPRVNPDLAGPDAPWGGWLSAEANDALDSLDTGERVIAGIFGE